MAARVLLCDDQTISRQLFEATVLSTDRYELKKSLGSAKFADIYCASGEIDLVIMDIVMKDGYSGLDAVSQIKKNYPQIKVIVVTSMPDPSFVSRAKDAGADSFWYKEIQELPMLEIMDRTMAGESIYPGTMPVVSIGRTVNTELSDREIDVLRVLVTGAGNNEISDKLCISVATVRSHISHMLEKTGFSSRTELAVYAMQSGIVVPE